MMPDWGSAARIHRLVVVVGCTLSWNVQRQTAGAERWGGISPSPKSSPVKGEDSYGSIGQSRILFTASLWSSPVTVLRLQNGV